LRKNIFTTYEISKLLGCDLTTVIKWINDGKLIAYRTPGGHRRVRKEDLVEFLKKYNLPIPEELGIKPKVLIVDDDPDSVDLIRGYLSRIDSKLEIEIARDGFEAGRKVVEFKPELVILDVRLPGINGYQVCRNIKSDEKTKNIKVLAITAYASPEDKQKMLSLGADAYLPKPFPPEKFLKIIKKLLK